MDEIEQLDADYAALQPQAILALLLGVASVLAFLGPLLLILPATAIGVAIIALIKVNASGGARKGAGMARLGAALGVLFAAAALVRGTIHEKLVQRQTIEVAQRWVDLLAEGRLEDALDLVTPGQIGRMGPRRDPNAPPLSADEVRALALDALKDDPLVLQLQTVDHPEPLETATWAQAIAVDRLLTRYSGEFRVGSGDDAVSFALFFVRAKQFELTGSPWRIENWQLSK